MSGETKTNKFEKKLVKIFFLSLFIFILSLIFSSKDKNTQKSIESAILNPKYLNEVALIRIQKPLATGYDIIEMKKMGDFWLLSEINSLDGSRISLLADKKIISSLLDKAVKIREVFEISNKTSDFDSLAVSEEKGTEISFLKSENEEITGLYFGYSSPLKNRIYFRSEKSSLTYETNNDFQQYLTTDLNYWAEGSILTEITDAVQITEIVGEERKSIGQTDPDFLNKADNILSLRHGSISRETDFPDEKIKSLILIDGNGRKAQIDFYKINSAKYENTFFYKKKLFPSPIDSYENTQVFLSENAVYEISLWTYQKLSI